MQKTNQKKAYFFALLSVLCWSTVATAFKISLASIDYFQLLSWTSFISSIVLFFILIIQKKLHYLNKLSKKEVLLSLLAGMLNPFLYYTILFKAYSILPAQEAMVLNYSWPLVLVLLSAPLLKQKLSSKVLIALLICFSGIIVIVTHGDFAHFQLSNSTGDLLALGSSIIWAMYWIVNMKNPIDNVVKLFIGFTMGFILSFISNVLFSELILPDLNTLISVSYIGLFEMSLTFVLWLTALQYSASTAKVSRLVYLSPFMSLILIHFVLGEKIHWTSVIGLILIILGIAFQENISFKNKPEQNNNQV
ncbi:MAG: DMT family transporter [Bacteroidota bacterium]